MNGSVHDNGPGREEKEERRKVNKRDHKKQ